MSKYQAFKNAIEVFQPGSVEEPILYSTTEVNEKGFKALLGRNIKTQSITPIIIGFLIVIAIATAITLIVPGHSAAASFGAFIPIWVIFFFYRTTLITIGTDGLNFYCIETKRKSSYFVFDKFTLPFDQIMSVKIKSGKYSTSFTFEFIIDDKNYKLKTSASNKMKKVDEQSKNLKYLIEALGKKNINII